VPIGVCWHLDRGRSAVPKSVRPERIAENLDVFDFALSPDEIAAVDGLDTGVRGGRTRTSSTSGPSTARSSNSLGSFCLADGLADQVALDGYRLQLQLVTEAALWVLARMEAAPMLGGHLQDLAPGELAP
jgi:hypothetical protein